MHRLAAGDPAAQRRFQEARSSGPHRPGRCFAQLAGRGLRPIKASASPGLSLAVAAPTRRAGCWAGRGLVGSGDAIAEHGDAGSRACALSVPRPAAEETGRSPDPRAAVPWGAATGQLRREAAAPVPANRSPQSPVPVRSGAGRFPVRGPAWGGRLTSCGRMHATGGAANHTPDGVPGSSPPGRDLRLPREGHRPALRLPVTSGPPPGCADPLARAVDPKAATGATAPLPGRHTPPAAAMPPKRHSRLSKSAHLSSRGRSRAHDGCHEHCDRTEQAVQALIFRFTG